MKHLLLLTIALSSAAAATPVTAAGKRRLAPLAPAEAVSTHGPFEMGACEACHDKGDVSRAPDPGRVLKRTNALCFDCHEEFRKRVAHHPPPKGACIRCHSPHNSKKKKLLL